MMNRRLFLAALVTLLTFCAAARSDQKVLYEKTSPYNTIVVTEGQDGLRTLWFEKQGARQSVVKIGDVDHLELSYAKAMPIGLAFVDAPTRILVIGLGGGTIPSFLHAHYPRATIDVVDIDPDVVDVAKRFFGFREDAKLRAHVADGRRFIEECDEPYDLIFLDAFGSEEIPRHLSTREFLQAVRRALTRDGVAVGNIWSRSSNPLYDSMVRTYQDVFGELYIFHVRGAGNKILVGIPRKLQLDEDELARRAKRISQEREFPHELDAVVRHGYERLTEMNARGDVLRDAQLRE